MRLRRFYPRHLELRDLRRTVAKLSDVNIVDKETGGDVGGQQTLSFPSEFPAGEIQDSKNTGPEFDQYKRPRQADTGQGLTQLTTERETSKIKQDETQHGMWSDSYHDDNQFEDRDLKLGESESNNDDIDTLKDPVYAPYSNGNGPVNSRYEDTDQNERNIVLHSSRHNEKVAQRRAEDDIGKSNRDQVWICVDLDGTLLSSPGEYQDQNGNHLFGEILPGKGRIGPREALQELVDGGARVSIWTARQYFDEESKASRALGLSPEDLLKFQLEEELILQDITFSDIYIGKKPPAHIFIDDKSIPAFAGDWDMVIDAVQDKLSKKANDPIKDSVDFHGIKVNIEWPAGSIRSYEGQDSYITHMKADYGYAHDIMGNDGEELDIYLADRDSRSDKGYIIEQLNHDGEYDEDKIVLGVDSEGEAVDVYLQHMPSYMLGDVREVSVDKLKHALYGEPEDRRGEDDAIPEEEKDKLPGGLADEKSPKDFDQTALASGVEVELEHTDDESLALEIAMDHLTEDPKYYEKLKTIEAKRAWVIKIASYSDLAVKVIQDANINETAKWLAKYVDFSKDYTGVVDDLVRAMLTNKELLAQVEAKYGPADPRRPIDESMEQKVKEFPSSAWGWGPLENAPPTATQPVVKEAIKKYAFNLDMAIKRLRERRTDLNNDPNSHLSDKEWLHRQQAGTQDVWPEDDKFDAEFTDGTEDRESREIRRRPENESIKRGRSA